MKLRFATGIAGLTPITLDELTSGTEFRLPGKCPFDVRLVQNCEPPSIRFEDVSVAKVEQIDGATVFVLDIPDTPLNKLAAEALDNEMFSGAPISFSSKTMEER